MNKLCYFLLAAVIFIQFPLFSYADECLEGDCENGTGTGFTDEGHIYSGEWRDGEPHGRGRLTISKGKYIEGRWEKGQLQSADENVE